MLAIVEFFAVSEFNKHLAVAISQLFLQLFGEPLGSFSPSNHEALNRYLSRVVRNREMLTDRR